MLKKEEDETLAVPVKVEHSLPMVVMELLFGTQDQHTVKELAALGRVCAREKLAAKRRAKQQARQALKQKEKAAERSTP